MIAFKFLNGLRAAVVSRVITRNKGSASDPVQQLFVDKIREYRQKSADGKFVDPSPAILKELKAELGKLEKHYGGGPGVDMTAFPDIKFGEPKLDPIDEVIPEKPSARGKKKKKKPKKK
ncbi:ATP synthase-coupling factor 6, mitochondrial [Helicoverpa armigera]|uniref:ATP synthase-coupling factor 6, mitochondrial n=1 Tax=Helicoverpa armigera TaxID=29058 RepID=UPI003082888F